ncbi:hypothetical protein OZK63_19495 [Streptomyces sp. UMAF16]|nr:hypothetical protein [Streptomyces sp. UMAF16]
MAPPPLRIGVVAPLTGRLSPLGAPLSYVPRALAPRLAHVRNGGRRHEVTVTVRDSSSEPGAAPRAVRGLAVEDGAHIVLTMAGTRVLPAVADAALSGRGHTLADLSAHPHHARPRRARRTR